MNFGDFRNFFECVVVMRITSSMKDLSVNPENEMKNSKLIIILMGAQ